jgi:PleD family two-component response regulator
MEQRAQKLLETLLENYSVKKAFQGLSASIGIAQDRLSVCNTKNIEKLMKRADTALYTAKQSGKARCCVDR